MFITAALFPFLFGVAFCFSNRNTVQVKHKGATTMDNLRLGDEVLVVPSSNGNEDAIYEPVYSFGHHSDLQQADFLQLLPSKLELSIDHMVFVENRGAIPASMVQVGDKLFGGEEVTAIEMVRRNGVYAPFTRTGEITVNGVKASCYGSLQNASSHLMMGSVKTILSMQWLAHRFNVPHRIWCDYFSTCKTESSTEGGISTWIAWHLEVARWCLRQHLVVRWVLLLPLLIVTLILLAALELLLEYPVAVVMSVSVLIAFSKRGAGEEDLVYGW